SSDVCSSDLTIHIHHDFSLYLLLYFFMIWFLMMINHIKIKQEIQAEIMVNMDGCSFVRFHRRCFRIFSFFFHHFGYLLFDELLDVLHLYIFHYAPSYNPMLMELTDGTPSLLSSK